jgi:hypothetical protein
MLLILPVRAEALQLATEDETLKELRALDYSLKLVGGLNRSFVFPLR